MATELMSSPAAIKLALQVYGMKKSLSTFGKSPLSDDEAGAKKVAGEDTDDAIHAALPYIVYILAAVGLVFGGISMLFYEAILSDFAAVCLLIIAPVVAFQKYRLVSLGSLRGQHNKLRENCNVLHRENNQLAATINQMETQMERYAFASRIWEH